MIGLQLHGNDESATLARKHSLKLSAEPWPAAGAGYVARLLAVQEGIRTTHHVIVNPESGAVLADPGLRFAWTYRTLKEDLGYVPGTPNPSQPFAVLFLPHSAAQGIQLDAQTQNSDPAYHLFWCGSYKGKDVISETWQFGAIDNHVVLDAIWGLFPISGTTTTPPVPGANDTILKRTQEIIRAAEVIAALAQR